VITGSFCGHPLGIVISSVRFVEAQSSRQVLNCFILSLYLTLQIKRQDVSLFAFRSE